MTDTTVAPAAAPILESAPAAGSPATNTSVNTPAAGDGDEDERISLAEARKLRKEAEGLRDRLKARADYDDLKARLTEHEQSKLSEQERTVAQLAKIKADLAARDAGLTAAEQRLRETRVSLEVLKLANRLRNDPDSPLDFVDLEDVEMHVQRLGVEFDDTTGEPKNLPSLLRKLAKEKPHLVAAHRPPPPTVGVTNPARSSTPGGHIDRAAVKAGRVTPEQIVAAFPEAEARRAFYQSLND